MHRKDVEKMKNIHIFKSAVIISALSMSICMVGCGSQEAEPVMSEAVEEVAPVEEEEPVIEEESAEEDPTEEEESLSDELEENEEDAYELTELSGTALVIYDSDTYETPSLDVQIGFVQAGELVTLLGRVGETDWVMIEQADGLKSFADGHGITAALEEDEIEETLALILDMNNQEAQASQPVQQAESSSTDIFVDDDDYEIPPGEHYVEAFGGYVDIIGISEENAAVRASGNW